MAVKIILFIFFTQWLGLLAFSQKAEKTANLPAANNPVLNRNPGYSYFASDRLSEPGKYDVYKIITAEKRISTTIIRGDFEISDSPEHKNARITVYNASNDERVGIYHPNTCTGNYLIILVPNVKYIFEVEAPGFDKVREIVEVPLKIDYEASRQEIRIKKNESGKTVLTINNWFADESELVYLLSLYNDSTEKSLTEYLMPKIDGDETELSEQDKKEKASANIDKLVKREVKEEEKKPERAKKAFNKGDYETALALYTPLLYNDPEDPSLNYYYGVSLYHADPKKSKAIHSLRTASLGENVPSDVFLYLGKSLYFSYMFKDGLVALEEYQKRSDLDETNKKEIRQFIENCKNGSLLMSEQVNIKVESRSDIDHENLLSLYNPDLINDYLRYKTAFFISPLDKKKNVKLLMCRAGGNEMIQVSYGISEETGTDLYKNLMLYDGSFGISEKLTKEINTSFDENHPYVSKDGRILYFSSKGHNSMGGYDIFKSTRTDSLSSWSKPVNMGYPINTPYDDILFVPDETGEYASFCSDRKSTNGKLEFIQIKIPKEPAPYSIIKGHFATLDSVDGREAIITVTNSGSGEIAGIYKTNSVTGNYLMILFPGIKYQVEVDCPGYPSLNGVFTVPEKTGDFVLRQEIRLNEDGDFKVIKINNYFTEEQAVNIPEEYPSKKNGVRGQERSKQTKTIKQMNEYIKPQRTADQMEEDKERLKQAKQLFNQGKYSESKTIYLDLVKVIDLDPSDAYRLGLSLYNTSKDKLQCVDYLEFAASAVETPAEVFYYLGHANQSCYRFKRALKAFEKFKEVAKSAEGKFFNIDKKIAECKNGNEFVNDPKVIEVVKKKSIDKDWVHLGLTELESGAKILLTPEDIQSKLDKKKGYKSTMFLSPDKNTILFASYGEDESRGKDIYKMTKLPNGGWSPIQKLPNINTEYDEDFPYLSSDGKTLFFSSKGHDSMGGYDNFKSTWVEKTKSWTLPVNLGSPVNSPFDDIYYME